MYVELLRQSQQFQWFFRVCKEHMLPLQCLTQSSGITSILSCFSSFDESHAGSNLPDNSIPRDKDHGRTCRIIHQQTEGHEWRHELRSCHCLPELQGNLSSQMIQYLMDDKVFKIDSPFNYYIMDQYLLGHYHCKHLSASYILQAQLQLGRHEEAESDLLSLVSCESASIELCLDALSNALPVSGLSGATSSAAFQLLQRKPSDCALPVRVVELILGDDSTSSQEHEAMALDILRQESVMSSILQVSQSL